MPITLDGTLGITTPAITVTGASTYTGNVSTAGNLTFTSTGERIIGDFTNATVTNRLIFQTSTTNSSTGIYALPSGTSTAASWQATNNADPTNASKILIATNGSTDVQLVSGVNGSGTYLPLTFYTNGAEKMRLDTSGRLLIGATSTSVTSSEKFEVTGGVSVFNNASSSIAPVYIQNADTTAATNQPYMTFSDSVGNRAQFGVYYTDAALWMNGQGGIRFRYGAAGAGSAEAMRIDGSGNVGIGGSPSAGTLTLTGKFILCSDSQTKFGDAGLIAGTSATGATRLDYYTGQYFAITQSGAERARFNSSGYLGIGTSTPNTQLQVAGSINSLNTFGFKNRIINGQMAIWQRATSGSASGTSYFGPDRWLDGGQSYTFTQSTDVPSGGAARYSLEINASAGSYGTFGQRIESYNIQDMSGQTVTFSFWAKLVSGGGGFNINISTPNSQDNYSASTGVTTSTPTITSSWAQYSVTFTAPSAITNGLQINMYTNSQAAQIRYTMFQFEIGPAPTSFDVRSITTELQLCQRYYEVGPVAVPVQILARGNGQLRVTYSFATVKRVAPSMTFVGLTAGGGGESYGIQGFSMYDNTNTVNYAYNASGPAWTASSEL
jgi:hypothetical protein